MSEETKSADLTSAWGILLAVFMSVVLGLGYVIALLFSIQVCQPCHIAHSPLVVSPTGAALFTWAFGRLFLLYSLV